MRGSFEDQGQRFSYLTLEAQEWYLATLRNKSKPRAFVNLGAAAHIAYGLAHAPIMIVNMSKAQPK